MSGNFGLNCFMTGTGSGKCRAVVSQSVDQDSRVDRRLVSKPAYRVLVGKNKLDKQNEKVLENSLRLE